MQRPLLTIAIPTWNRCGYLEQTLAQLQREAATIDASRLEILVSDNASEDDTALVVRSAENIGLSIRSVRNPANIGSDANIAQCFDMARGEYVLILGDDDLLVDGCLPWLWPILQTRQHGVINLRAYGFDLDFRDEFPGAGGKATAFRDASAFLAAVNSRMTLISSSVLHKDSAPDVRAHVFCGGHLVQVHLVIELALRASSNLYVNAYKIACKRNNSSGYNFSQVFVEKFGQALDQYRAKGLSAAAIRAIDTRMIIGYLPFYLLRQRLAATDMARDTAYLRDRFRDRFMFWVWLYPICAFPRPVAVVWGSAVTILGRVMAGDSKRGMRFMMNRIGRAVSRRNVCIVGL